MFKIITFYNFKATDVYMLNVSGVYAHKLPAVGVASRQLMLFLDNEDWFQASVLWLSLSFSDASFLCHGICIPLCSCVGT